MADVAAVEDRIEEVRQLADRREEDHREVQTSSIHEAVTPAGLARPAGRSRGTGGGRRGE